MFSAGKMLSYPNLKGNTELLKINTKDDELSELKQKTEKHDFENSLQSLRIDKGFFKEVT